MMTTNNGGLTRLNGRAAPSKPTQVPFPALAFVLVTKMTEKPMTVPELAERWGCNEDYVHEMIESGRLRAFTLGGKIRRGNCRITHTAVSEFLSPPAADHVELETALKGFVYFVGHGQYLKIGFTALKDWRRRIASIQTNNPERVRIWKVFAADMATEGRLHEALNAYCVSGEWFNLGESGKAAALAMMLGFHLVFDGGDTDVA